MAKKKGYNATQVIKAHEEAQGYVSKTAFDFDALDWEFEPFELGIEDIVGDIDVIRQSTISQFIKELNEKIKNVQWHIGEHLAVVWSIDIVRANGNIRGGSGTQRNMPEYVDWRRAVYERDRYTCLNCGGNQGLNAHHIKSWVAYPELRFDVDNGKTLCFDCHNLEHGYLRMIG